MGEVKMMPLSYFEAGGEYTGQIGGMRYLIKKEDDRFMVYTWKGPFRFDAVKKDSVSSESFEFNDDGRGNVTKRLRCIYEDMKDFWDKTVFSDDFAAYLQ